MLGFIGAIIIGGLAGWIASTVMKTNTGILANIALGIGGSIALNFVLSIVGISGDGGLISRLIIGAIGAGLLIWLYRKFKK